MAPAQTGQIVAHRRRGITQCREFVQPHRTVTLGQLLAILAMDQGDMGKDRARPAHRVEDLHLAESVGQVVVAPDHMGHGHVAIVHHHRQHIGGRAVRPQDDHVVQLVVGHADRTLHGIVDHRFPIARGAQADRIRRVRQVRRIAPRALERLARMGLAPFRDLLGGGKALVGGAVGQHLPRHLGMAVAAFELADRLAVPVEAQPSQPLQDRLGGLGRGAGAVGILDPQQEPAAPAPRVKPVEQRRARAADMQVSRGRRGKAGDDWRVGHGGFLDRGGH